MNNLIYINKPLINFIKKAVSKKYYSKSNPGQNLKHNLNDIIEGILFMCKTGIQIKFVEYKNIPGSALLYHFYKWTRDNIFYNCWTQVYNMYQKTWKYNTNLTHISVDCSLIKSMNGNDCIGRNPTDRGRNGTKISAITDLIGVPVGYYLSGANVADCKLLDKTLKSVIYKRKCKSHLYADKGYSSKTCINIATINNVKLSAPNKKNFIKKLFSKSKMLHKVRYTIEALFGWVKGNRKIIIRYDKLIKHYESYLLLAFSMVTCKKILNQALNQKST